ncbi:Uma2 family endonuclease [Streptomyces sp. 2333.5]|nr:Uma2 family endonuclease [Streptomyces sp. 2333.5]SEE56385.1 Endonuclease, Uma2 family (restriction endonuclease fold) [Streptomyces sp. 2314.4]SEE83366.1 Endonuclease, Uma2 family (restriction endonuclease fold) [Streptomyces sp. 2112.2]
MMAQMESPVTTEEMRRFEQLDAAFPDYHAEMIDGEVYLSTVVTSAHGQMVIAIAAQLSSQWCVMTEVDTVYDGWQGKTLLRPDLSVVDPSYRGTRLKQFPADEVILVVEVVSESNPENDTDKKVKKYAQAGIPYYLIVNPIEGKCLLYSLPSGAHYRASLEADFGEAVPIGAPVDAELDTTALYTY